uniref:Uncharacterized protein n=1 Tax=Timema poppense TaxID=170557 RepID=A0A7R9DCR3_TIMPO|nr:unnamed protein product [Timema poppensis]
MDISFALLEPKHRMYNPFARKGCIWLQEKREPIDDNKYSPYFTIPTALYSEPREPTTLPTLITPHRQLTSST